MEGTALITDPLPLGVDSDWVEFTQDTAAFAADADNGLATISAKQIRCSIFGVFPFGNVFRLMTQITPFHLGPFLSTSKKSCSIIPFPGSRGLKAAHSGAVRSVACQSVLAGGIFKGELFPFQKAEQVYQR